MFTMRRFRHTFPRLTILLLVALTVMLLPLHTAARGTVSTRGPTRPTRGTLVPTGTARTVILNAVASGAYTAGGFHGGLSLSYYLVGNCTSCSDPGGPHYRNYFVFDLSGIVGTITGAALEAQSPHNNPPRATYTLHNVTTPISTLERAQTNRPDIYDALGTGTLYGSHTPNLTASSPTAETIDLNQAGLSALNSAVSLHQQIAFGGDYPTPTSTDGYLFGDSFAYPAEVQLILQIGGPSLFVTPDSGYVGQTITLTGSKFGAHEPITIYADCTCNAGAYQTTTTASGTFNTSGPVYPAFYGVHTLIAVGQSSHKQAQTSFTTLSQDLLYTYVPFIVLH